MNDLKDKTKIFSPLGKITDDEIIVNKHEWDRLHTEIALIRQELCVLAHATGARRLDDFYSEDEIDSRLKEHDMLDIFSETNQKNDETEALIKFMESQPAINNISKTLIKTARVADIKKHFGDENRMQTHRRIEASIKKHAPILEKQKTKRGEVILIYSKVS
ncbi:MAG: hypothetical protein FWE54_01650 [Methanimicrococcus sp.]|nr:hypothetical protein [Methanimicrococcus sp.]